MRGKQVDHETRILMFLCRPTSSRIAESNVFEAQNFAERIPSRGAVGEMKEITTDEEYEEVSISGLTFQSGEAVYCQCNQLNGFHST